MYRQKNPKHPRSENGSILVEERNQAQAFKNEIMAVKRLIVWVPALAEGSLEMGCCCCHNCQSLRRLTILSYFILKEKSRVNFFIEQ